MPSITDLVPDGNNARVHSERNIDMIRQSLKRYGANRGMVATQQPDGTYKVYAGNGVLEAARAEGIEKVKLIEVDGDELPVIVVNHLSDSELTEYAIADNRTGETSEFDVDVIMAQIEAGADVSWMWTDEERDALFADLEEVPAVGLTDPDDVPELPEEPTTQPGDLWILGKHRVLCGDSTSEDDVDRLFEGIDHADMVWTDPPYGVAVGDKNKMLDRMERGSSNRVTSNLLNDTLDEPALQQMLAAAFDIASWHCRPGAVWHVAAPQGPLHLVFAAELKRLGIWRQTIQWVKNNATFSPMGVDYHWQAEPIFHGWMPGAKHTYLGGRKQTTVWEVDRPTASPDHPTMKPVALVDRALRNHTRKGEVVFDPFLGSGTTLITSHSLDRVCVGMELDPKYVDVIVRRWEEHTGMTAVRGQGGGT